MKKTIINFQVPGKVRSALPFHGVTFLGQVNGTERSGRGDPHGSKPEKTATLLAGDFLLRVMPLFWAGRYPQLV